LVFQLNVSMLIDWLIDWLIVWSVLYGTWTQDRSICAILPEDNITSNIVKESNHNIVDPLMHLINSSFRAGIVPICQQIAKVVPLYKLG